MGKSVTSPPKKAQPFDGVVNTSTITVAQSPIGMRMCKLDILEERNNTNCRLSLSGGMSASTHACAHTHTSRFPVTAKCASRDTGACRRGQSARACTTTPLLWGSSGVDAMGKNHENQRLRRNAS